MTVMSSGTVQYSQKIPKNALPEYLNYITEELKIRAKTELSEDDETRIKSLKLLRSMLKEEKNLNWQDEDLFLLSFLRAKKFDAEKAFNLIKGFYKTLDKHKDFYHNLSFERLKKFLEINTFYVSPFRDSKSSVIIAIRYVGWDPQIFSTEETLVYLTLAFMNSLRSPSTQIAGIRIIIDFKDISLKQFLAQTPSNVRFLSDIVQNMVPCRIKGFHIINENHFFSHLWSVCRRLLSKKLQNRGHFHGSDLSSLHKILDPSILPADFGGELPPFNNADWREKMLSSFDYFKHLCSFGYKK